MSVGGGSVSIENTGNVTGGSAGITAENFGAGAIAVTSNGNVHGGWWDALAGKSATGAITIVVNGGNVQGGTSGGSAVGFYGGSTNTLTNYGSLSSLSGQAIYGNSGDETVHNHGTVTGNVNLGGGTNNFINQSAGTFNSTWTVDLGAAGTLTNAGTLSPGGNGTFQTTALTGSIVQTTGGKFTVDIDTEFGASDRLTVTGTALLSGKVAANMTGASLAQHEFVILSSEGTLTNNGITVDDTAQYDYDLVFRGNDLVLTVYLWGILNQIHSDLTPNQHATGAYLDALIKANPNSGIRDLINSVRGMGSEAAMIAALDRLHPEHYLAQAASAWRSSQHFVNSLPDCPQTEGTAKFSTRRGDCYWVQAKGGFYNQDRTRENIGGSEKSWGVMSGVQVVLGQNWRLGGAFSYEQSQLKTNNQAKSDGDSVLGGLVLKRQAGRTELATSIFGGYGWYDTTRLIGLPDPAAKAKGESEVGLAGGNIRLSHSFDGNGWYVKPLVDGNATYLSYGDLREKGVGAANLAIAGGEKWIFSVTPALEIGSTLALSRETSLRPFIRGGVTATSDANFALTSGLAEAPAGFAPFTVHSKFDEVFARVGAGLDVISQSGMSLNLSYEGQFSDHSDSQTGNVKLRVDF